MNYTAVSGSWLPSEHRIDHILVLDLLKFVVPM